MRASSFDDWSESPLSAEEIEARDPLGRWRKRGAQAEPPGEPEPEPVRRAYDNGNGLITTEPRDDAPASTAEGESSAWEKWVLGTLDNERAVMIPWIEKMLGKFGDELLDLIEPHLKKIGALELKLAKLDGAVDVLRGKGDQPPLSGPGGMLV